MRRALVILAACGGGAGGDDGVDDGGFVALPGMQEQGRHLLGDLIDPVDHRVPKTVPYLSVDLATAVDAKGRPIRLELHGQAALRSGSHVGKDAFFDGVVLESGTGIALKLGPATQGGKDVAAYKLQLRNGPDAPWTDACSDGGDAIPFAGRWNPNGSHERDPDRISFGCADGVAYKCTQWGYLAGDDPSSMGWRAHQACTRMARADYCANGTSHTRTGTCIWIYDTIGVAMRPSTMPQEFEGLKRYPPGIDQRVFEAAWPVGDHRATCLSRLRWQTLPLHAKCADTTELADPRDGVGAFCDAAVTERDEPMLINTSSYSDLALHVWIRGDDRVSTVRGFYDPSLTPDVGSPFETPGYVHEDRAEGRLLRRLASSMAPADFDEVQLWIHPTTRDRVIATAAVMQPLGFVTPSNDEIGFEGYVAKTDSDAKNPLKAFVLFHHPGTNDYWSTATPAAAIQLGYERVALIGYVFAPEASHGE